MPEQYVILTLRETWMLREILNLRQREEEGYRRWFTDDYWDLFIWYDEAGRIVAFQLCYGKPDDEHALTWQEGKGYRHTKVSDGESTAVSHMTPILVRDGLFEKEAVASSFTRDGVRIDREVMEFVSQKLHDFLP
jgi:hypothetical protein